MYRRNISMQDEQVYLTLSLSVTSLNDMFCSYLLWLPEKLNVTKAVVVKARWRYGRYAIVDHNDDAGTYIKDKNTPH